MLIAHQANNFTLSRYHPCFVVIIMLIQFAAKQCFYVTCFGLGQQKRTPIFVINIYNTQLHATAVIILPT